MPDLSYSDRMQLLARALTAQGEVDAYVRDVYDTYFTYESWASYNVKTYRRDYTVGDGNKVTLGERSEVIARTVYEPVTMSAMFSAARVGESSDGYVLRTGKLFEAGVWPDKGYSMTPEELAAAAAAFCPVELDLEHIPTVLDGKLGVLQSVEVHGSELFGTAAIPEWLDTMLEEGERKVSCTWDKASKKLTGLAIVRSPRITDAALYAAFSEFAGKRHSAQDLKDLQTIHDLAVGQGAECQSTYNDPTPPKSGKEQSTMTEEQQNSLTSKIVDGIRGLFGGGKVPDPVPNTPNPQNGEKPAQPADFSIGGAEFTADQINSFKADAETFRAEALTDMKAAHVRCFGKEMEESRTASFSSQPVSAMRELTTLWNETADAKFGIGKGANGGGQRETMPNRLGNYAKDAPPSGQGDDAEFFASIRSDVQQRHGTVSSNGAR